MTDFSKSQLANTPKAEQKVARVEADPRVCAYCGNLAYPPNAIILDMQICRLCKITADINYDKANGIETVTQSRV